MKKLTDTTIDLAYSAAEFRQELDALLSKHGVRIGFGWYGKWAAFQAVFPQTNDQAVTLMKCAKGKGVRYVTEQVELMGWPKPEVVQLFDDLRTALVELGSTPLTSTRYRTCAELAADLAIHLRDIEGG